MDEQRYRFGVGVLVVAAVVIGVILIMFFGAAPNFFTSRYQFTVNFQSAPGVGPDTPIRKNGVNIGRVKDVKLLPDEGGVDLLMELDSKFQIRQQEIARIGTGSFITGDAVVEFVAPGERERVARFDGLAGRPADGQLDEAEKLLAATYLRDGDYLKGGQIAPDPLKTLMTLQESFVPTAVAIEKAGMAIEKAGTEVGALAQEFRVGIGGDGRMQQIVQKTELAIDKFNQTFDGIQSIINDPALRGSITAASERLPKLMDETESLVRQTRETVQSFQGVGEAAEETMRNVAEFTEPLGAQGEKIVTDAVRTMNNLDALLTDLRKISNRINSSDGTLNKLINDDQLYNKVVRTIENVEQMTVRLQPIINDARVFADKAARDPRQFGIRGALEGPRTGLGIK